MAAPARTRGVLLQLSPRLTNLLFIHRIRAAATNRPTRLSRDEWAFIDGLAARRPRFVTGRDRDILEEIARRLGISECRP
jgi:hypothetical protein